MHQPVIRWDRIVVAAELDEKEVSLSSEVVVSGRRCWLIRCSEIHI